MTWFTQVNRVIGGRVFSKGIFLAILSFILEMIKSGRFYQDFEDMACDLHAYIMLSRQSKSELRC